MDFLTHLCLPATVIYVLRPEFFDEPWRFTVVGFGLFSDFDKFLGTPGLLHSGVTLVPITLLVLGVEYTVRRELAFSPVVAGLIWSHLLLDFLDGGPVPLLFPLVHTGIGLQYPVQAAFGEDPLGLWLRGPLVAFRTVAPRPGLNTYGFIQGYGVASALLLGTIVLSKLRRNWGSSQ